MLGISTPPDGVAPALEYDDSDDSGFEMDIETGEVIDTGAGQQQESSASAAPATQPAGVKPYEQLYTTESAIAKIKECTTKAQAEGVMAAIVADYDQAKKPIPNEVDGAYTSRLAAIEQQAAKKK